MNYAETLAYWYLRLNGFFPLSRFVLHRNDHDALPDQQYAADSDLIAIRLPGVQERIGGQPEHWDDPLFRALGANPATCTIALIVEAKGGYGAAEPGRAFEEGRLSDAVHRMGRLATDLESNVVIDRLRTHASFVNARGNVIVAKIVIGFHFRDGGHRPRQVQSHFAVSLRHITRFIQQRVDVEHIRKQGEWHFFPSDLFQYLIWQREINEQEDEVRIEE